MGKVFLNKQFSNYLGENRAILDTVVSYTSDNIPSPTPTPSFTPTMTPTPTITPTNTPTPSSTPPPSLDPDAVAYLNAVVAAGGTVDATMSGATDTLVLGLKSAGIWSLLDAAYPFLGGTLDSTKFNLLNPLDTDGAYRITFSGSWIADSNGVVPSSRSSSNFGNTHWVPSSRANNNHYYRYINQVVSVNCDYAGAGSSPYYMMGACDQLEFFDGAISISNGGVVVGTAGFSQAISRENASIWRFYRKLTGGSWNQFATGTQTEGTLPSVSMYIGSINGANFPERLRYGFLTYGQGLTSTQISDLDVLVSTFNSTLSRNF